MKEFTEFLEILGEDLEENKALSRLASFIVKKLPTTFCRILLREDDSLKVRAAEPIRETTWNPALNHVYAGEPALFWSILGEGKPRILIKGESDPEEFQRLVADFGVELGAVAIFPLISRDKTYGILLLGEQRTPPRVPYGPDTYYYALLAQALITELERRKAEVQLRQVAELLDYQMAKAEIIFLKLDSSLNLIYYSPGASSQGIEWENYLNSKDWLKLLPREYREEVKRKLENFLSSQKQDFETEFPLEHDKTMKWVRAFFWRQPSRAEGQIAVILLDITQLARQRQALESSYQFLSAIIDQSPEGILVFDRLGTAIRLNQAAMQLFALERDTVLLGKYNIFRDEVLSAQGLTKEIMKVFEEGTQLQTEVEYDFSSLRHVLLPGRPKKWLRITIFPVKGQRPKPEFVIGLYADITEEKIIAQERERRSAQIALLFDVSRDMSRMLDLQGADSVLQNLLEKVVSYFRAEGGALVFYGEKGEKFSFKTILPSAWEKMPASKKEYWLFQPIHEAQASVLLEGEESHFSKLEKEGIKIGSYLGFPLIQAGDLVGMLCLFSAHEGMFKEEDKVFLGTVAQYLSMGLARLRLEEILRQRLRDLEFIHRSSLDLVSGLDINAALEQAVSTLRQLLDAQGVIIYEVRDGEMTPLYWRYRPDYLNFPEEEFPQRLPKKVGQGLAGLVAQTGEPLILNDADRDPRSHHIQGTPIIDESFMAVPLKVKDRATGVISVVKMGLNQFGEKDLEMLSTFASSVAVALENNRLYLEVEKRRKLMEILNTALRNISQKIEIDELLKELLRMAVQVVPGAQTGSILVKENDHFLYKEAVGYDFQKLRGIKLPQNVVSRKLTANRAVLTKGEELMRQDLPETIKKQLEEIGGLQKIKVLLSAPIYAHGQLFGYFSLENHEREDAFGTDAQEALWLFAQQASIAVENALLFKEKEEIVRQLERDVETIRELAQVKEDFLYTISHEFKTPLMISMSALEFMSSGKQTGEKMWEYAKVLERNLRRLAILVDNLLIASKKESLTTLELRKEDLSRIVREEVDFIELYAREKNINVELDLPEEPVFVKMDQFLMRLAVTNILSNAIKFSLGAGTIKVQLTKENDKAILKVQDQGMGIPSEDLPHIFEKFFRSTHGSKAIISGTGLGLHITKLILDAHQGEVRIESQVGKGTTVSLTLPLK
ncbi:MAG: GAF domain-containing protein [Caldiserica bacterium]|jgi:signal transduction histidine kinase/PAS domain-containing protein/putative methionine-R-sulfoxide reductase with GAF domain|nr:GAF domain-containing protein [Caldisericota bacterium]